MSEAQPPAPARDDPGAQCSHCGKSQAQLKLQGIKLKPCPCRQVRYCDASCQRNHWPQHKLVCPHSKQGAKKAEDSRVETCRITLVDGMDGTTREVELRGSSQKLKVSDLRAQVSEVGPQRRLRHPTRGAGATAAGRLFRNDELLTAVGMAIEVLPILNAQFKGHDWRQEHASRDLSHHDLSDCNFDKMDLRKWNLSGADLSNASFVECDLRDTVFDPATKFAGAKFYKARLPTPIDFRGADVTDCLFQLCDLTGMQVDGLTILTGADFDEAKLPPGVQLQNKNLAGCRFAKCDLTDVNLDGANITKAYFTGASGVDHVSLRQRGAVSWD